MLPTGNMSTSQESEHTKSIK